MKSLKEEIQQDFNSTMVRLKVTYLQQQINALRDFNSTMVRLKESKGTTRSSVVMISIPLWYD